MTYEEIKRQAYKHSMSYLSETFAYLIAGLFPVALLAHATFDLRMSSGSAKFDRALWVIGITVSAIFLMKVYKILRIMMTDKSAPEKYLLHELEARARVRRSKLETQLGEAEAILRRREKVVVSKKRIIELGKKLGVTRKPEVSAHLQESLGKALEEKSAAERAVTVLKTECATFDENYEKLRNRMTWLVENFENGPTSIPENHFALQATTYLSNADNL